jgi:hypothetical protein
MAQQKEQPVSSYQDLKCIWMNSNLVEYKLCNLNFDCENCAFDKLVRHMKENDLNVTEQNKSNILDDKISKINSEKFEPKIIYIKNQLILKHLFANTYYIGLNPVLADLLDEITEIKEGANTTFLSKNQKIIEIKGTWGSISITSPINFLMLERIHCAPDEIKNKRWLALIGVSPQEITIAKLNYSEWEREQERIISLLEAYKINTPEVGDTLPDGGKSISFLSQFLGLKEYRKLLTKILTK